MISDELGGESALRELIDEAKALGLGWLQDIVPNHASYSQENKEVYDLWRNGAGSSYAVCFDVNWHHPNERLNGKILLPSLAKPYTQCLTEGQLTLSYNDGFKIRYNDLELPVTSEALDRIANNGCLEEILVKYNQNRQMLNELLSTQPYVLAYWRTALKHINYRRFFDVADLIGVRMEDPTTFQQRQQLIFKLTEEGYFSGLRIDHIDGLYEPEEYLKKLRQKIADTYLLVEKVLTNTEQLPSTWPVQGTTGYEFINYLNKLFIRMDNQVETDDFYKQFSGKIQTFSEQLYEAKKQVIETAFLGDIENLSYLLYSALITLQCKTPYSSAKLSKAVIELFACFPIYRTYTDMKQNDSEPLRLALKLANRKNSALEEELAAIQFLLEQSQTSPEALHALMKLQQFTGAIVAKGLEDTALYRYNRLLSLNEVGGNPAEFGLSTSQVHDFNQLRLQNWPLTLNSLSTHDTKRGEDVRARLNVVSEVPNCFRENTEVWEKINHSKKKLIEGRFSPDKNEEYYLYQTLLGAYPWEAGELEQFSERVRHHFVKALREAKTNSSWLSPNVSYEEVASDFVAEILKDTTFLDSFRPVQRQIAFYGVFNSLAQTLLKITCPGIPDFYQGAELWDLNLVDPDNRRPVNFQKRQEALTEILKIEPQQASELLTNISDGKVKLYLIYRALGFRRKWRLIFESGSYIPLAVKGIYAENAFAFARRKDDTYAITVVPRFLAGLLDFEENTSGKFEMDWLDTYLCLPEGAPTRWRDALTEKTIQSCCGRLSLNDILASFPVALLLGESDA